MIWKNWTHDISEVFQHRLSTGENLDNATSVVVYCVIETAILKTKNKFYQYDIFLIYFFTSLLFRLNRLGYSNLYGWTNIYIHSTLSHERHIQWMYYSHLGYGNLVLVSFHASTWIYIFSVHILMLFIVLHFEFLSLTYQCPNLMNLSRVVNPPKTGFNWAPA